MNKQKIKKFLNSYTDIFGDAYITKDNLRLSIKENIDTVFADIERGDKIFIEENGLALVVGFSDNAKRKYVKLLVKNKKVADILLKKISEEIKEDLFVKIKKNNPVLVIFKKNKYKHFGFRGQEILLKKTPKE